MSYDFNALDQKFEKTLSHINSEVGLLRTGKASAQMLDPVEVEVYGSRMKVHELATVAVPDATLITITPWDKNVLENIEKAIASAGLNLNPIVDKDMIRIAVPPLTEERRKEIVKLLHNKVEDGRKMFRTVRAEAKKTIEDLEGSDGVSEDDIHRYVEELEKHFKAFSEKLDQLSSTKEAELMRV